MNWPDLAALSGTLEGADAALGRWWLPAAMAGLFAEAFPLVGLVSPGLTLLIFAGFKSASLPLVQAIAAFGGCLAAIVAGDWLAFLAGRAGAGRWPRLGARLRGMSGESRDWSSATFGTLLFYQFPPYARMFAPALLGLQGYPAARWSGLVLAASTGFVTATFGAGYAAGLAGGGPVRAIAGMGNVVALLSLTFLVSLGGIGLRRFRQVRR